MQRRRNRKRHRIIGRFIVKNRVFAIALLSVAAVACSAAPDGESQGTSQEAIAVCPLGEEATCPTFPSLDVVGTWSRQAGTISETLELRADHTFSLSETSTPVCFRFPCAAPITLIGRTEGQFAQSGLVVKLHPEVPDAHLPEGFDIVLRRPMVTTAEGEGTGIIVPPGPPIGTISLHAVEGGQDIYLTRTTAQDCPTGTTKCNQCGAYPSGGVCTTFVCLPPTRRCFPVP